jgi:hypothetical protein
MIEMTGSKMQASDTSAIRNTTRLILRQPEAPDIDFITDMFSRTRLSRIVPILAQTHRKRAPLVLRETWPIGEIMASGDGRR